MPSPIKKGLATITWGSIGVTALSAIVESFSLQSKTEVPEIENGDGFTATEVVLNNGFDADLKCVYDSAVTWPVEGDMMTLKRLGDATGKPCLVCGVNDEIARKKEGMVAFKVQYRPLVTS